MPRSSVGIRHVNERDMEAFRVLWNCQHIERAKLPLTDNRLKVYEKQGLIDRCRDTNDKQIIRCTAKGRKYISKLPEFAGRKPYISHTATAHNCRLAEAYLSLTPEQQRNWRTERELSDLYHERLADLWQHDYDRWCELREREWSSCDGGVVEGEQVIMLVEVITENYTTLELKEAYGEVMNTPITYYKS